MTWFQELPLFIRLLPALSAVVAVIGVLVYLERHPVGGERDVLTFIRNHHRELVVYFGLVLFLILPSLVLLAGIIIVHLALAHFEDDIDELIRKLIEVESLT